MLLRRAHPPCMSVQCARAQQQPQRWISCGARRPISTWCCLMSTCLVSLGPSSRVARPFLPLVGARMAHSFSFTIKLWLQAHKGWAAHTPASASQMQQQQHRRFAAAAAAAAALQHQPAHTLDFEGSYAGPLLLQTWTASSCLRSWAWSSACPSSVSVMLLGFSSAGQHSTSIRAQAGAVTNSGQPLAPSGSQWIPHPPVGSAAVSLLSAPQPRRPHCAVSRCRQQS